jgi:hypothetical protein
MWEFKLLPIFVNDLNRLPGGGRDTLEIYAHIEAEVNEYGRLGWEPFEYQWVDTDLVYARIAFKRWVAE